MCRALYDAGAIGNAPKERLMTQTALRCGGGAAAAGGGGAAGSNGESLRVALHCS